MEMFRLVCPSCKIPDCTDSFGNYYEIKCNFVFTKNNNFIKVINLGIVCFTLVKPCGFFNYLLFSIH